MVGVGKRIRALRVARGYTQWQVAKHCGITPGMVLLIERGVKQCPEEIMRKMAFLFRCRLEEILRG